MTVLYLFYLYLLEKIVKWQHQYLGFLDFTRFFSIFQSYIFKLARIVDCSRPVLSINIAMHRFKWIWFFPYFQGQKTHKNKPEDGVSDPNTTGIFWDAPSDKSLHHSLCINNNVCTIGPIIAISVVFQPNFSVEKLPIMAIIDDISVFWLVKQWVATSWPSFFQLLH